MQRLASLAISDSGFIFDPVSGHSYTTNQIGLEIIRLLKEDKDIPEIIEYILDEFDVNRDEFETDLIDFTQNLKSYYLIGD
ncbi:MAG: PqqD family protein [Candidatus Cloacimonetes bacterium]|nr:PqqD family protein [Candidatus Cloacimonadota bacterium]